MRSPANWITILLVVVLAPVTLVSAQPPEVRYAKYDFKKLMSSFDASLRSDIPGVVESTIYNLLEYKSYFPDREYSRLDRVLNEIGHATKDSAIAYKATLTRMYLAYGSPIDEESIFNPYDHSAAFKQVADQLTRKFLISRSGQ